MSIFGKDHTKDLAYLNEERERLWFRVTQLEKQIVERPSDIEKEAKQASKETSRYRNKAQATNEEADVLLQSIKTIKDDLEQTQTLLNANKVALEMQISVAENSAETLGNLEVVTNAKVEVIEAKISKVEAIFDAHPELAAEIDTLDDSIEKVTESNSKVAAILRTAAARKADIDVLYYEIVGSEETDEETGETIVTEGLRTDIENQYEKLEEDLKAKTGELTKLRDEAQNNFKTFHDEKEEESEKYLEDWRTKYGGYEKTINDLLPQALTAGLSGAFLDKKDAEQKSFDSLRTQFLWGIVGLVAVSLIPFGLSINFLVNDVSWDVIINRAPRMVLAILPLYLPVLWVAYAANKKMNLSKRLIEEYSHKEVLSRTFHGLSTQIEKTQDEGIVNELRTRLLVNFLAASAENPGKLISNYEASDHPVIELMEKYGLDRLTGKQAKAAAAPNSEAVSGAKKVMGHAKKAADVVLDAAEDLVGK
jgi:hypothetical protein